MNDPARTSAREAARRRDGRFGIQGRPEARVDLADLDVDSRRDIQAAAARARGDVACEMTVIVDRPDLEPDYEVSSPWRRLVLSRRRSGYVSMYDLAALDPAHAKRSRDFCLAQAARFGANARVGVPDPQWTHPEEWQQAAENHAYESGLADAYAYWACALDAGGEPDPTRVETLCASVREPGFVHSFQPRFSGDPWPDRTAEWEAATGGPSEVDERQRK